MARSCKYCNLPITKTLKHDHCKQKQKELWEVVEQLILQEYTTIKDLTMRNSYYHLLPFLSDKVTNKTLDQQQYDYFFGNYTYYQGDKKNVIFTSPNR